MAKKDKFIVGTKVGMTQLFDAHGRAVPVTLIEARPFTVTMVRTKERDGYDAVQIGWGRRKRVSKPEKGHLGDRGPFFALKEFRLDHPSDAQVGDVGDASSFSEGDAVRVSGLTKAKGFQGVVKRHRFAGGPASHGQKHSLRAPGSIGATWPQRVLKGTRMAGRMGGERRTIKGLSVLKVDTQNNLIALDGAIPGRRGTIIEIRA